LHGIIGELIAALEEKMTRKGFLNQKLGKQRTHRGQLARLKVQFERRTSKQRGMDPGPKKGK